VESFCVCVFFDFVQYCSHSVFFTWKTCTDENGYNVKTC
jgi:hypothetical protein